MMRTASAALLVVIACAGCIRRDVTVVEVTPDAMSEPDVRSATNLPQRFTVVTPPAAAGDCPAVLRDTGLHATLRLHRSVLRPVTDSTGTRYNAVGDYSVDPRGVYGEEEGEGLRVDCDRLHAIGVVRL